MSIHIPGPMGENLGQVNLYKWPSRTRIGVYHYVIDFPDERGRRCTCDGFRAHGHCWHVNDTPVPKLPDIRDDKTHRPVEDEPDPGFVCCKCGKASTGTRWKCCPRHVSERGPDVVCSTCVDVLHPEGITAL